jgi:hypothetical protein
MVTASTSMQYNEASAQAERIPVFCKKTRKLLTRVSVTGSWPADLRQWAWCRGCHMEHEITKEQVEEARAQDARATTFSHGSNYRGRDEPSCTLPIH